MITNTHSAKFLRERKMMLILPLLILPFITMAFWALGGGKTTTEDNKLKEHHGLNLQLPEANLRDDRNENKLSFYKEAEDDSLKRNEILLNDPAYRDSVENPASLSFLNKFSYNPLPPEDELNNSPYASNTDDTEQRIYNKINDLNQKINQPDKAYSSTSSQEEPNKENDNEQFSNDIDRLHGMMEAMSSPDETDPEMLQLNSTLDKILDIQNPQRVKDRLKERSAQNKEKVFRVSKIPGNQNISLLDTNKNRNAETNSFYGLEKNLEEEVPNAIEAVIHESQTLRNGSTIKCRLLDDIYINGDLISKGNFLFGMVALHEDRLEISITSIRHDRSIYPVNLEVFDMDGLPGIYIPGAISRELNKQSADNGLQSMDFMTMNTSIEAQAAASGISAAKSFLGKKVKQVKVSVKAGYKILLKDKNV